MPLSATQPSVLPKANGVLACQHLEAAVQNGLLKASAPILPEQIQPASLDLRLGPVAYRVRAGFMPGKNATVMQRINELKLHEVDLTTAGVLERGAVYIIPLMEGVDLPDNMSAAASPKSTTGRLDLFTRLMTDYATNFDRVPTGHTGGLYLEVAPQTFGVIAHQGDRLIQLRLRQGESTLTSDEDLKTLNAEHPLVFAGEEGITADIQDGLWLSMDLKGQKENDVVAFRAKRHAPLIDLRNVGHYGVEEFWEPIARPSSGRMILNPEDFYIMVSRERCVVPPGYSAEMVAYDHTAGELRVHYAGFFDPGFGCHSKGQPRGTQGVLEVRSHDVPFVLEHGQPICRLVYEKMAAQPNILYGTDLGSNYAAQQGPKLSKHFKMPG